MKDFSQLKKYYSHRAGFDFPPPYGLYVIPVKDTTAILCYASAGIAEGEEDWEHVSFCIREKHNLYFNMSSVQNKRASAWKPRWPTPDEIALVRDVFWEPFQFPIQVCPQMHTAIDKRDFRLHLWFKPGIELPPNALLESML